MTSIRCIRMNHINMVLEDFDGSVEHMKSLYSADLIMDMPLKEWHACLVETGRVIFEIFSPGAFLLNARYGAHYLGVEFQVASMADARAAIAERGIRISRDIVHAVYTHPQDCFGTSFEFWDGEFHSKDWPLLDGRKLRPAEYWRDEHPLGLTGYKGYSQAVADIDAASRFLQDFVGAEPVYEEKRASVGARAIGLRLGDGIVELLTPVAGGPVQQHLYRYGDGMRATRLGVRNVDQARRYFAERGIELVPGDAPGSFAIPAESNHGVIFEFSE